MKQEKHDRQNITLDDLFALKRAERPSPEFWASFQQQFHVRQRAAAVEPKRWWFVLPRVFASLSRYQMPVGAAAVLAVTFLSFREYREPGFEIAYTASPTAAAAQAVAPVVSAADTASVANDAAALPVTPEANPAVADHAPSTRSETGVADALALSPLVVWAGTAISTAEARAATPSPSERFIAANFAAIADEQPHVTRLLGAPKINLAATSAADEPLTQISLNNSTRERLFAYQPNPDTLLDGQNQGTEPDMHRRLVSRLSDEQLYDSVRRVTAGGDRFTVKF